MGRPGPHSTLACRRRWWRGVGTDVDRTIPRLFGYCRKSAKGTVRAAPPVTLSEACDAIEGRDAERVKLARRAVRLLTAEQMRVAPGQGFGIQGGNLRNNPMGKHCSRISNKAYGN